MGLLTALLTLPVTGPVKGVAWIAQQVADLAEDEMAASDPRRELAELERARMFGEISEEDYRRREEALWERLQTDGARQEHRDGR